MLLHLLTFRNVEPSLEESEREGAPLVVSQVSGKAKEECLVEQIMTEDCLLIMEWEFHESHWKMMGRQGTMGCLIR